MKPSAPNWTQGADIYLTSEAADILRVSKRTLIRWRGLRIGPAWSKLGQRVIYTADDLDAYVKAKRVEPVREEL